LIPLVPLKAEEYVVATAWTSWITLFVLFIRSEDM